MYDAVVPASKKLELITPGYTKPSTCLYDQRSYGRGSISLLMMYVIL